MSREKWKDFIKRKGLDPRENRKKFGKILFTVTIFSFLLFMVRFVYIVGFGKVGKESLSEKTQQLHRGSSVEIAKRGTIYDRNGDPIAEDATSYSLYAILDKKHLGVAKKGSKEKEKLYVQEKDHYPIANILNSVLGIEKEYVIAQLNQKERDQVEFGSSGKGITLPEKQKIEEELKKAGIKGMGFQEHSTRIYLNRVFASHLIGYAKQVNPDNEAEGLVGFNGLEAAYNKELSGKNGKVFYQKDSSGRRLPGTSIEQKKVEDGKDIYTTLDSSLQVFTEEKVEDVWNVYKPENITVTLANARTGEILAASQRPSFNPETEEGLTDENAEWQNLLVEVPFEPGSTMKAFTVAAAIDLGKFNENAGFNSGEIQVDDAKINDHDFGAKGYLTYRQALSWSSNVGMVLLEQAMGQGWQEYIKRFHFDEITHCGLKLESAGYVQNGTTVDRAMTTFGQGIAVTPFQMVQAYTAIANEGNMMKPQLIRKIVSSDGKEKKIKHEKVGEPITAASANKVLEIMNDVVESRDYGTGFGVYGIDGYMVSAKTGTAQISENGQYLKNQYLQSVVQIAPTEDPQYIIYVTIKKPPMGTDSTPAKMVADISNPILKRALDLDITHQESLDDVKKESKKDE